MEQRLDATLGAVKTMQPALVKFYDMLSDEQKARFNALRSAGGEQGGAPQSGCRTPRGRQSKRCGKLGSIYKTFGTIGKLACCAGI